MVLRFVIFGAWKSWSQWFVVVWKITVRTAVAFNGRNYGDRTTCRVNDYNVHFWLNYSFKLHKKCVVLTMAFVLFSFALIPQKWSSIPMAPLDTGVTQCFQTSVMLLNISCLKASWTVKRAVNGETWLVDQKPHKTRCVFSLHQQKSASQKHLAGFISWRILFLSVCCRIFSSVVESLWWRTENG